MNRELARIVVLAVVVVVVLAVGRAEAHRPPSLSQHTPVWKVNRLICAYWGRSQCRKAQAVAQCESTYRTPRWHTGVHARNGQYLGLFQMGANERRTYGHGPTAREQVRAAYRYYKGSGWRPWACA